LTRRTGLFRGASSMSSAWSRGQESQPGRRAEPAQGAKRQRLGRRDDGAPVCRGVSRQAISRGGCPGGTFCLNPACQTTKESLGGAQTISQHVQEKSADAVEAWVRSFHGEFALPEGTHRCICTSCYNTFQYHFTKLLSQVTLSHLDIIACWALGTGH